MSQVLALARIMDVDVPMHDGRTMTAASASLTVDVRVRKHGRPDKSGGGCNQRDDADLPEYGTHWTGDFVVPIPPMSS